MTSPIWWRPRSPMPPPTTICGTVATGSACSLISKRSCDATLDARGVAPAEVFSAVAEAMCRCLQFDNA
jgi:hypothetical protein